MIVTSIPLKRCAKRRTGRPAKASTQHLIAVTNHIIFQHPLLDPKELQRLLLENRNIEISRNYAKTLIFRYRQRYNVKLPLYKTKYRNKLYKRNRLYRNNNNKQLCNHKEIVNIVNSNRERVLSLIEWYILMKEAQIKRGYELSIKSPQSPDGYNIPVNEERYRKTRYHNDLNLSTKNVKGEYRRCIQRLLDRETPLDVRHAHYHNKHSEFMYHITDHDLCKFLSNYLGIPYKSRIYFGNFGKGHFISTDSSGFDFCHINCLEHLLYRSLEGFRGIELLRRTSLNGKLLVGNEIKHVW